MAEVSDLENLCSFIERSPTPWHATTEAAHMLRQAGFDEFDLGSAMDPQTGFVVRDGSLMAWNAVPGADRSPIRFIGAHTDSPGLRVRPNPDVTRAGTNQLSVEVYGGALVNSWLDRDLTLAGRVIIGGSGPVSQGDPGAAMGGESLQSGFRSELVHPQVPLARVPQLAIHLDRDVSSEGLRLNPQNHLSPIWGLVGRSDGDLRRYLAEITGVGSPDEVAGWDLCLVDTAAPIRLGQNGELLCSARLDDLACCYGALAAFIATDGPAVVILTDHEEVGSLSATGAQSSWFLGALRRLSEVAGVSLDDLGRCLAGSEFLSADMAHATHPNYPERHEPNHNIELGGGPVIKFNSNNRYATDAIGAATFAQVCADVEVPVQRYSHRGDIACGSTIGPMIAANLGVRTVDVGMPQLSMHSIRELMAVDDVTHMVRAFTAWFDG